MPQSPRKKVAASLFPTAFFEGIASSSTDQPFQLREYQKQGIQECLDAFDAGTNRIGVSAPTGSGKTAMFAYLIPQVIRQGGFWKGASRVLIIVHSTILAEQIRDYLLLHCQELGSVGVEQGGSRASRHHKVVIATWQSLIRPARILRFKPSDFQLVVADEAHHCGADSYLSILHYFNQDVIRTPESKLLAKSAEHGHRVKIVGFSGTFARTDERELGWVFQEIVYHLGLDDLVKQKHLCEPIWMPLSHKVRDLWTASKNPSAEDTEIGGNEPADIKQELDITDGDIITKKNSAAAGHVAVPKAIAKMVKNPTFNDLVVEMYIEKASTRKATLVFCQNLALVDDLTQRFVKKNIKTASITSKMPDFEREKILSDFKDEKYAVLINCQLMAEGADVPMIDCIIIAKPVSSINLWTQMIGRGLRTSTKTGKTNCLILSFFDGYTRLSLGVKPELSKKSS